jgi:hypothetical protein
MRAPQACDEEINIKIGGYTRLKGLGNECYSRDGGFPLTEKRSKGVCSKMLSLGAGSEFWAETGEEGMLGDAACGLSVLVEDARVG